MKFAHAVFARDAMLLVASLTIASALFIGRSSDMQPKDMSQIASMEAAKEPAALNQETPASQAQYFEGLMKKVRNAGNVQKMKKMAKKLRKSLQVGLDMAAAYVDCEKKSVQGDLACKKKKLQRGGIQRKRHHLKSVEEYLAFCRHSSAAMYNDYNTIDNMNKYWDEKCKYLEGPDMSVCQQVQAMAISRMSNIKFDNQANSESMALATCQEMWGQFTKTAREGSVPTPYPLH